MCGEKSACGVGDGVGNEYRKTDEVQGSERVCGVEGEDVGEEGSDISMIGD